MPASNKWMSDPENQRRVLELYRDPTISTAEIARRLKTSLPNVWVTVKKFMPAAEKKALASVRYSMSKLGDKNPMKGKTREQHHNWQGAVDDGYGYLTILHEGKRQFLHRVVMAQVLGLPMLPETLDVHHIDSNTKNNDLNNLALVTRAGHQAIHALQVQDSLSLALKKSTLAQAWLSMTSRS